MIALTKELAVNRSSLNNDRPGSDARGFVLGGESGLDLVRCVLQINRTRLPIDVPAALLAEHRLAGAPDIILTVPAAEPLPVRKTLPPTPSQRQAANAWLAEMEDFDRF